MCHGEDLRLRVLGGEVTALSAAIATGFTFENELSHLYHLCATMPRNKDIARVLPRPTWHLG